MHYPDDDLSFDGPLMRDDKGDRIALGIARAQAAVARYVSKEIDLAADLIADRRKIADRE